MRLNDLVLAGGTATTALLSGAFALRMGVPLTELVGSEAAMVGLAVGGAAAFALLNRRWRPISRQASVRRGLRRPVAPPLLPASPEPATPVLAPWEWRGTV